MTEPFKRGHVVRLIHDIQRKSATYRAGSSWVITDLRDGQVQLTSLRDSGVLGTRQWWCHERDALKKIGEWREHTTSFSD